MEKETRRYDYPLRTVYTGTVMDSIKLTIEIPAGLATALTDFLKSFTVVAENKKDNHDVVVVDESVVVPSVEEVVAYCKANKLVVNGKRFFNFYNDRGWKDTNGNYIRDWKDRIALWDEEDRKKGKTYTDYSQYESKEDIADVIARIDRMSGAGKGDSLQ